MKIKYMKWFWLKKLVRLMKYKNINLHYAGDRYLEGFERKGIVYLTKEQKRRWRLEWTRC